MASASAAPEASSPSSSVVESAYHSVHSFEDDDNDAIPNAPPPVDKLLSVGDAVMTLTKGNLGPGILNLPHAFALTGYGLGSCLFLVIALQGIYTMWLLVYCKNLQAEAAIHQPNHRTPHTTPCYTFMGVARTALGPWGGRMVEIFLFVSQGGVCCVFLSLISTNLQAAADGVLGTLTSISLVTCVLLCLVLLRFMKDLFWLNATANSFMVLALTTATVAGLRQVLWKQDQGEHHEIVAFRPSVASVITFTSDMFYAFEGMGLVLPVENSFDHQQTGSTTAAIPFSMVVVASMGMVAAAFVVTGVSAAIGFPDIESGSITAYLKETYPHVLWYTIVNGFVLLAVGLTFPLQLTPAAEVVETWVTQWRKKRKNTRHAAVAQEERDGIMIQQEKEGIILQQGADQTPVVAALGAPPNEGSTSSEQEALPESIQEEGLPSFDENQGSGWILQRWGLVLLFAVIVFLVDDLGILMSLFGAIGQTTLAGMPCAIHLAMQYQGTAPRRMWQSVLNAIIVLFCIMIMIAGCVQAMRDIYQEHRYSSSSGGGA